jgi:isopenicillin N synthase-like dioxygenase
MRLFAIGLGLDEHYFESLFEKSISTFRLINYPVHDPDAQRSAKDGMIVSTERHRDTSVLTLLTVYDFEGLQVCMWMWMCSHSVTPTAMPVQGTKFTPSI